MITGETVGVAGGVERERRRVKLIQIQYLCMKISKTPQKLMIKYSYLLNSQKVNTKFLLKSLVWPLEDWSQKYSKSYL